MDTVIQIDRLHKRYGQHTARTRLGERRWRAVNEHWNRQIARWQQSCSCHRCHVAFVAGSGQAVAPEQFGRVIVV